MKPSVSCLAALAALLCACTTLQGAGLYHLTDLGDLPGGIDESMALAINESGQVVGRSSAGDGDRAFVWTSNDGMQDLGNLPSGTNRDLRALAINENGQIPGYGDFNFTTEHAFRWTSEEEKQDVRDLPGINSLSNRFLGGGLSLR